MNQHPGKGYRQLRKGRFSQPAASYFITMRIRDRAGSLACGALFDAMLAMCEALDREDSLFLRELTLMPDHMHMIMRLGRNGDLSDVIRLFKGRSSVALREANLHWQKGGYFDHWLRPEEPLGPVFRYIFMNPYRKALIPAQEKWPFFYCCPDDWIWFQGEINSELPFPEWLGDDVDG